MRAPRIEKRRSRAWSAGWAAGVLVVLIAAGLLLTLIGLGRRIIGQAEEITTALDGTRENTAALYEVTATNTTLERIARSLRAVRTGGS
jgi:hypothetical protein